MEKGKSYVVKLTTTFSKELRNRKTGGSFVLNVFEAEGGAKLKFIHPFLSFAALVDTPVFFEYAGKDPRDPETGLIKKPLIVGFPPPEYRFVKKIKCVPKYIDPKKASLLVGSNL